MKRINVLLSAFAAFLFVACSEPLLFEKAMGRVEPLMSKFSKELGANDFRVSIEDVVYPGDSICVVQFYYSYGRYKPELMEYVLFYDSHKKLNGVAYPVDGKPILGIPESIGVNQQNTEKSKYERFLRMNASTFVIGRVGKILDEDIN